MITLQRDNVVRRAASDEAARKLEEQGFARTGGIAEVDNIEEGVALNIDLDALADKLAERLKAGEPLTGEAIAKTLLDEEQPAKPAANPKGGKAAPKAGAAHDGN